MIHELSNIQLADRKELYKIKDFCTKEEGTRKLYWAKKQIGYCKVTFLQEIARGVSSRLPN